MRLSPDTVVELMSASSGLLTPASVRQEDQDLQQRTFVWIVEVQKSIASEMQATSTE